MSQASAMLFSNGTAAYFDKDGEQIPEIQSYNWKGLHKFLEEYPEADVAIGLGRDQGYRKLEEDGIARLKKQIKNPEEDKLK